MGTGNSEKKPYKVLLFTCYGGCATGVSASKALIRIWEEHPEDVKIGCLPALVVPWKRKEILERSKKRILVDACAVACGAKLAEREGMPMDRYIELTSELGLTKRKELPTSELEEEIYEFINKEVEELINTP